MDQKNAAVLQVATDGSCHPNPGPGGWAWVDELGRYEAGSFGEGTNNVGELTAIKMALLAHPDRPIEILYDSQYAANCVTTWGPSWVEKARRARGEDWREALADKANLDLILETMEILAARPLDAAVTWTWVRGHDADNTWPLNTTVDRVANSMIAMPDGHHESGTTEIDVDVAPARRSSKKRRKRGDAVADMEAKLSRGAAPAPGGEIRCCHSGCTATVKAHYWGKVKSGTDGWFHKQDGQSWCPEHIPSWVGTWRASKKGRR